MVNDEKLHRGIAAARAGQKREARELLLAVVATDPQNELAWMWLSGLLEEPDERIAACERALAIDPGNARMRAYRDQLLAERPRPVQDAPKPARPLPDPGSGPDPDLEEKMRACQAALAANPQDARAQLELKRLRYLAANPLELGTYYEEQGDFSRAMHTYERAFAQAASGQERDAIYRRIHRLENQQKEKIVHIPPGVSVARLSVGPPLLYLGLLLLEVGIDPLAGPAPLLWVGLLWAGLGGFLAAMAAVHSYHPLWQQLFKDIDAARSPTARLTLGAIGWALVLIPHLILFFDAIARLRLFRQALTG